MAAAIRALVFDMDGTLYESEALNRQYTEAVADYIAEQRHVTKEQARELLKAKQVELEAQLGRKPTTTGSMIELGFDLEDWIAWRDARVRPEDVLGMNEELRAFLGELKRRYLLVVVTNNSVEMTRRTLKAIGIDDLFDHVFTLEDTGLVKPDPDIYRRVAEAIGVPPEQCLSVGDRPHVDLEPAAAAGMKTFHATGPRGIHKLRESLGAG